MKIKKVFAPTLVAFCLMQLFGCSSWQRINNIANDNVHLSDQTEAILSASQHPSFVIDEKSQWINPEPLHTSLSVGNHQQLPYCQLTYSHPGITNLNALTALIASECQIPVTVTPDALSQLSSSKPDSRQDPAFNDPLPESANDNQNDHADSSVNGLQDLFWQGPVSGLLDTITARLGLSWEYVDQRVVISYLSTRTFPILFMDNNASFYARTASGTSSSQEASGGLSAANSSATGDADSEKGQGTTSQATTMEIKSSLYKDIASAVTMMLTPGKGRMNLTDGELTVKDTPRVLSDIGRYINDRNTQLNRQVVFNVQVYTVENKDNDQLGIDWKAVFTHSSLGLSLSSPYSDAASEMMSSGISILDGKGQGSTALVQALAEQTHLSVVTQVSSMTTNLSAVPVQVALQQDYASDSSTENTANVGSSSSVSKSTVTTGLNMTILPYLMPDSTRMQLQFAVNMSDDPTFRTFTSQSSSIELMKTRMKTFTQRVLMNSGQTLVLSGYQSVSDSDDYQGVDHPHFFLFGGGASGSKSKSSLVILITPVLMG